MTDQTPGIDETLTEAYAEWEQARSNLGRGWNFGHLRPRDGDPEARMRLLEGRVAYLTHMLADLTALVDVERVTSLTREEMAEWTAKDLVIGGLRYATATLLHGDTPPDLDWMSRAQDGCPHPDCQEDHR